MPDPLTTKRINVILGIEKARALDQMRGSLSRAGFLKSLIDAEIDRRIAAGDGLDLEPNAESAQALLLSIDTVIRGALMWEGFAWGEPDHVKHALAGALDAIHARDQLTVDMRATKGDLEIAEQEIRAAHSEVRLMRDALSERGHFTTTDLARHTGALHDQIADLTAALAEVTRDRNALRDNAPIPEHEE